MVFGAHVIVMLFVLFLSSSPLSQNVSVELSVNDPTIACREETFNSAPGVKSFKASTMELACWKNKKFHWIT